MPITAYYKLIDWWLLTLLNLLALTLVFHTYLAYVVSKTEDSPERKLTKVKPFYEIDFDDNENEQTVIMKQAIYLNTVGNLVFVILLVTFNIGFWIVALAEHFRPAEYYISGH